MENQRAIERLPLAAVAAAMALLSACAGAPVATPPSPLPAIRFAVTQTGTGPTARYVYCEESACPPPSKKTPVARPAPQSVPALDGAAINRAAMDGTAKRAQAATEPEGVDVAFPFNSPRLRSIDPKRLTRAASPHPGARIAITARSDCVGPRRGQRKVARARAKAMRRIVAKQSQGAQVSERREVAGPAPVSAAEQARQRRGTVLFNPPVDVQVKGSPK